MESSTTDYSATRGQDSWVGKTWPTSLRSIQGQALKNCIMFDLEGGRPVKPRQRALGLREFTFATWRMTQPNIEHPLFVGFLLVVFPPIGVALLWTSKRYNQGARMALTLTTLVMMCLATFITAIAMVH